MSDDSVKLPTATDEVAAGLRLLAEAAGKRNPRQVRRLAILATGHFDAARTLDALSTTEIGRAMQRDMKSGMAGLHELFSRLPGMSGPLEP